MDALTALFAEFGTPTLVLAAFMLALGGFSKGAIGFALPTIAISGVGSFMPIEMAIAAIILPGIATNVWQTLHDGAEAAWSSIARHWRMLAVLLVMIYLSAQLITLLSDRALFIILGSGISIFGIAQLAGLRFPVTYEMRNWVEPIVGLTSGFFGGLAGVWGPPVIIYLISLNTPKVEQVRILGIAFLIGSVVLLVAHINSGLLDARTTTFSAALIPAAMAGMWIGYQVQYRLNQQVFRQATLIVLIIAGLNLLRRGLMG